MESVKKFLAAIAGSKKAMATVVGILFTLVVAPIARRYELDVSREDVAMCLGLIVAYVLGQGQADKGKEAAKVNLAAATIAAGRGDTAAAALVVGAQDGASS